MSVVADEPLSPQALRELYAKGGNIMARYREASGTAGNSTDAILTSYDLQSGSYVEATEAPERRALFARYVSEIAATLAPLDGASILEAGVGEATTLCGVRAALPSGPTEWTGFDLSWSRLAVASHYARRHGASDVGFFVGDLFRIPVVDDAYDIVYTAHAIEPNHGRESEILQELYRVTRRWLVLFEPSYELGSAATRERIETHGYCRGLPARVQQFGWQVTHHALLNHPLRDSNQTAVLVISKPAAGPAVDQAHRLACPQCRLSLRPVRGQVFCAGCDRVFPVLDGIPCLVNAHGILASKFPLVDPRA